MKLRLAYEHRWDLPPYEAQQVQKDLATQVLQTEDAPPPQTIGGVELNHSRFSDVLIAAINVVDARDLRPIESVTIEYHTRFPHIPGLLSFRETPAIIAALEQLAALPDLLLIDGPGLAHPNGLGVASHLGVMLDLPTVGCAKGALVGSYVEPEVSVGSSTSLVWQGEIIGTVYRSKNRVAPLFVSVGHRVSRKQAQDLVTACCNGYRLPEPLRLAHQALAQSRSPRDAAHQLAHS